MRTALWILNGVLRALEPHVSKAGEGQGFRRAEVRSLRPWLPWALASVNEQTMILLNRSDRPLGFPRFGRPRWIDHPALCLPMDDPFVETVAALCRQSVRSRRVLLWTDRVPWDSRAAATALHDLLADGLFAAGALPATRFKRCRSGEWRAVTEDDDDEDGPGARESGVGAEESTWAA
jgi:hypothetical protein